MANPKDGSIMSGQQQSPPDEPPPPLPPRPMLPSNGSFSNNYYYSQPRSSFNFAPQVPQYYNGSGPNTSFYNGTGNFLYPTSTNRYGGRSFADSEMVRLAEQSSRNALRSVESVIYALSSVSQMLETTLNAFYSSFRAIIGVADQFVGLKYNLQRIFGALAIFKFVRWFWRRLLIFVGLAKAPDVAETVWNAAEFAQNSAINDFLNFPSSSENVDFSGSAQNSGANSWSAIVFFLVAVGGPYLIYKLMTKMVSNIENNRKWVSGDQDHYMAVALYDFVAGSQHEISLSAGQRLRIAPKELQPAVKGWLLACVDENEIGLVPANYVRILGRINGGSGQQTSSNKIPFV